MEKYLITGTSYEYKKLYALFYTGEYFVCDLGKLKLSSNNTEMDLMIIQKLDNKEFKNKLLKNNDNYWNLMKIDYNNESICLSDIKCYKDPVLISYEYEHFKSLNKF